VIPATTMPRHPRAQARAWLASLHLGAVAGGLARAAVPAALVASGAVLAASSRSGGAETLYLSLLAGGVLLAVAALAPRPAWEISAGGVLTALLLWVLPAGPTRGAALALLLTGLLAIASCRRLRAIRAMTGPLAATAAVAAALAVGLQLLLRSDRLLALDPRALIVLFAMPVAAAAALVLVGHRHGTGRALVAAATVLALSPGWGISSTLAVVALAAGELLLRPRLTALQPLWMDRALRLAAGLILLAPLLWEPRAGLVPAAAGLALALSLPVDQHPSGVPPWRRWAPGVPAALALAAAAVLPGQPWESVLAAAVWVPFLLPAWGAVEGRRIPGLAAALALLLAAARLAPAAPQGLAQLAAPAALAALMLPARQPGSRSWRDAAAVLQGLWSTVMLATCVLAAAYPWLRPAPLPEAAAIFGLGPAWPTLFLLTGAVAGLAAAAGRWRLSPWRTGILGAFALLALAIYHVPPVPVAAAHPAGSVSLEAAAPRWRLELPGDRVGAIVLDTSLSYAADLPALTPVATLRLEGSRGERVEWTLRAGEETGEWAAERLDVASRPGFLAPRPWLVQVVEGGFFARRYRCRFGLDDPHPANPDVPIRLTLERRPELPPEVTLALFHVEVQP
jgi:hypothetical protein